MMYNANINVAIINALLVISDLSEREVLFLKAGLLSSSFNILLFVFNHPLLI
ncbi:MAG: hypothetical protein Ct9H90mP7_3520 [Candidatus Neomarinimicrobiota bacterium]|nr:MAG: hypothetical protein Ct9H90mP7_3520 [Candidatus Neomarinimicrobiota bacterium]